MGTHGLLIRTMNLTITGRLLINNRIPQISFNPQIMALRSDVVDKFKKLNIPEKPKKPLSPYLRYLNEIRSTVTKENPTLNNKEILSKCAQFWNNVTEDKKKRYIQAYQSELEEYDKKMLSYDAKLTKQQREGIQLYEDEKKRDRQRRRRRKLLREHEKPKKPMLPFMRYVLEQSKIKNISLKEMLTHSKGEWAKLSAEGKKKYEEEYKKDKSRYEYDLAQWEAKMIEKGHPDLVRIANPGYVKPLPFKVKQEKEPKPE